MKDMLLDTEEDKKNYFKNKCRVDEKRRKTDDESWRYWTSRKK